MHADVAQSSSKAMLISTVRAAQRLANITAAFTSTTKENTRSVQALSTFACNEQQDGNPNDRQTTRSVHGTKCLLWLVVVVTR